MQATQIQQQELLSLGAIDSEIARAKRAVAKLRSPEQHEEIKEQARALSASMLAARNALDDAELELKRTETDLKLVEAREAKDQQQLKQTSVPSIASGIQHELATLARRRSELEDVELAIMEQLEILKADFDRLQAQRASLDEELAGLLKLDEQEVMRLQSGMTLQSADRATMAARIPAELLAAYERKAARGVPVGRLVQRDCSACHIGLDAVAHARISSLPENELAECPECNAFLVRG